MLTALITLSKVFFDVCLLRKGPQDLPKSSVLLAFSFFLYLLIDVLLSVQSRPVADALMVSLLDAFFLAGIVFLILRQHQHLDRLLQTMTTLFGTGVMLGIFILPLVYGTVQNQYGELLQQIIISLLLLMVIWNVAILAHIIRHAISTTIGISIMIAILYCLMNSLLFTMIFPEISVK